MAQTPRPGSSEGYGEKVHWGYENGPVKKSQREFLCDEARRRISDPVKLAETLRWINSGRTTTAQARQLCIRWNIDLPSGTTEAA